MQNNLFGEPLIVEQKPRVFLFDWGVYVHKAIYASVKSDTTPPMLGYSMLLGDLNKLKATLKDKIILCVDSHGKGSWRRDYDSNYKANRKLKRKQRDDIDWDKEYKAMNDLLANIEEATPFRSIKIDRLEADDIISFLCRKYKDKKCIVVSIDSDYEQLCVFDNVKLFSPTSKKFKKVKNPYGSLLKKIEKETADNLITAVQTKEEYEIRNKIVNLMVLPEEIDKLIEEKTKSLDCVKEYNCNKIMFPLMRNRFKKQFKIVNTINKKGKWYEEV